ncbi:hypothetical protein SEA_SKOG_76 [Gordonia phage Skog]|uniref:Uncharacterized protein n=1 Tax=Gordonia phage Skog TaxID=2704033 RepID=A0A6G6XJF8_9CAUD|nr:hypothetical protein KHQ85_gp076 [Gordonia phage Skog]QIG58228.1 hypothetical protein SEA_SKOG_76 [Gordonia phage Skog]
MSQRKNRFADAESVETLIHYIVGAASMCWEKVDKAGVFDDAKARSVADDGLERLRQLRGDIPDEISQVQAELQAGR